MKTVAIISEYNPFHTGHKHQIDKIREELGADTRIVAIMSGNYTQRGEIAIIDKNTRAKCAVECGVNLVLELPFPFSSSSAEIFAQSGVKIADSIGVIDYLSFGSESGDLEALSTVAKNMQDEKFIFALREYLTSESGRTIGYPVVCQRAYNEVFSTKLDKNFFASNNILALEYIKAINKFSSSIKPHTVKRLGADYSELAITEELHQSATAIREMMQKDFASATKYVPEETKDILLDAFASGKAPTNAEALASAIITHFRLNPLPQKNDIHDVGGGLYNRLYMQSMRANNINALIQFADTKKFTTARIRRAIWYSFFGVTSSEALELPLYTQALAMDCVGQTILKAIKKKSGFPVITKPSATDMLGDDAKRQKLLADRADFVFELTRPCPQDAGTALKTTPYIKKVR